MIANTLIRYVYMYVGNDSKFNYNYFDHLGLSEES